MGRKHKILNGVSLEEEVEIEEVVEEEELDMHPESVRRRERNEDQIESDLLHKDNYY